MAIRTGNLRNPTITQSHHSDDKFCRSPWTNKYFPAIDDGFLPSEKLRAMEMEANELFDSYRELYFEGGTSSVYLWDLENGFAGCFLIKKSKYTVH
jgi:capping protein (actin filament) muscle Z-line, beta